MSAEFADYQCFFPNEEDGSFEYFATGIVESIRKMPGPTNFGKGTATAINEELDAVIRVLNDLSPEARQFLIELEMKYIDHDLGKRGFIPDIPIPDDVRNHLSFGVWGRYNDACGRLMRFAKNRYTKGKEDLRHKELAKEAASLWERHGGRVTQTSGQKTFVAFLETLIEDTGLKVSARTLIQNYL
jgi:hypothetical protein